ncbi:radical SAM protein [Niveibacterium terrae]|uniref:radical SAM protein n=1 Tax=Niveibacterium terrae TaxID=3373598 RepID=UPI003A93E91C
MNQPSSTQLGTDDHNQVLSGFLHVYPVVSRRVGGVSIGINLNLNNACNWRCVYCQVPELKRGAPDAVDVARLEHELAAVLEEVLHGDFMQDHVPEGMRQLCSIAIAGNGEPTLSRQFPQVINAVLRQVEAFGLLGRLRIVLITNGSMMHRPEVQDALRSIAPVGGEAWVKVDRGSEASIRRANQVGLDAARARRQVETASACCPTWVQTCMFQWKGEPPDERDVSDYVELVASFEGILGVQLYGVAREPMLDEGQQVSPVSRAWLEALTERLRARGVKVQLCA